MNYKTDAEAGAQVESILRQVGVNTPFNSNVFADKESRELTRRLIAKHMKEIMLLLGADMNDDSLQATPQRIAKMYQEELFYGLDVANFPACTTVENKMEYDEMITVKGIEVMSVCEHHFVTISGTAKISYIPNKKILGLSKFNRIVDYFARRPQIQERLTEQIYYALRYVLGTEDIAVQIEAEHFCVKARGVKHADSRTTTTKLGGEFMNPAVRAEFLKS